VNQDFREWLDELVDKMSPGQWLPSDARIGKKWDISARTVRRAMARLASRGVVERVQGRGTRKPVARPTADAGSLDASRSSAERLCEALVETISSGQLRRADSLPQIKHACLQYHVSDKTVIRAYELLQQRRLVRKIGRYYRVGGFEPLEQRPLTREAYLAAASRDDLRSVFEGDLLSSAYRKLERELRACGILLKCTLTEHLPDLQRLWVNSGEYPAGVYLWRVDGKEFDERVKLVSPLMRMGSRPQVPIVVDLGAHDELGDIPYGLCVVSRADLSTTQSRSLAEFLTDTVRRNIVLLIDGRLAMEDAREGFLKYQNTVYEVLQHARQPLLINQAIMHCGPATTPQRVIEQMQRREQDYIKFLQEKYGEVMRQEKRDVFDSLHLCKSCEDVVNRFGRQVLWLCTRDSLAQEALEELAKIDVKVPDEIALVTLESSPESYHLGVSACTPDYELVGYIMAHALIGDIPLKRTRRGFLRVPCPPIERTTTPRNR